MKQYISNDYRDDIGFGRISRKKAWTKFGEGTVKTTTSTVATWLGGNLYEYIPYKTSFQLDLVSSSAADTNIVRVIGLNGNWKEQTEYITLTGTTPVTTTYAYQRVYRMQVMSGGDLIGNVSASETGETAPIYAQITTNGTVPNQSQMMVYTCPAGHQVQVDDLEFSSYEAKKTNMFTAVRNLPLNEAVGFIDTPFTIVSNYGIKTHTIHMPRKVSVDIPEMTDVEIRGYTEVGIDTVYSAAHGFIVQYKSVPIDTDAFTATTGDKQVSLAWDALTPADSSDQTEWTLVYGPTGGTMKEMNIAKGATNHVVTDLDNGIEYTFTLKFKGFDSRLSTGMTDTATPS